MNTPAKALLFLSGLLIIPASFAQEKEKIKLETLKIQANKELPKMLFIVPWKNNSHTAGVESTQKLVLHSLYGDLFDPVVPDLNKLEKSQNDSAAKSN